MKKTTADHLAFLTGALEKNPTSSAVRRLLEIELERLLDMGYRPTHPAILKASYVL